MKRLPLLLMLVSAPAAAAVTLDAAVAEQSSVSGTLTFSVTVAADANEIVVCGSNIFGAFFTLTGATHNGDNLVMVSSQTIGGADTAYMWRLDNPDTGTHDVVLTWDGTGGAVYGYAASFKGVNTSAPVSGIFNATGTGSSLSQSAVSAADGMVMDCGYVSASGTPGTEGAGQTEITNDGLLPSVSSYKSASGSSTSMAWTLDGSVNWAHFGVGLSPTGGGGGATMTPRRLRGAF